MRTEIISVICVILSIAGIIFLGISVKNYTAEQNKATAVYREYSSEMADLEKERKDLKSQINLLTKEAEGENVSATVTLLICDMNESIYTEIFPVTQKKGISCTLAISAQNLPDAEGNLTSEQVDEMVKAGWKIIPEYSEGDGDNGITEAYGWILDKGYSADGVVLIDNSDTTEDILTLLSQGGFPTVVIGKENGTADDIYTEEYGDIWFPNAINYKGSKDILDAAAENKGNLFLKVVTAEGDEKYDGSKLSTMIDYIMILNSNGKMTVCDTVWAKNYSTEEKKKVAEAAEALSQKVAGLESEIDEIDEKIEGLYEKYKK